MTIPLSINPLDGDSSCKKSTRPGYQDFWDIKSAGHPSKPSRWNKHQNTNYWQCWYNMEQKNATQYWFYSAWNACQSQSANHLWMSYTLRTILRPPETDQSFQAEISDHLTLKPSLEDVLATCVALKFTPRSWTNTVTTMTHQNHQNNDHGAMFRPWFRHCRPKPNLTSWNNKNML